MRVLAFTVLAISCQVLLARPWQNSSDEIMELPGLGFSVDFRHYSGYLEASKDEKLFYWFVEAEKDPETSPLIIWFNGGPGCSSILGILLEHGPFLINEDGATLRKNKYSWNKFANIVYIESPPGVGFSYHTADNYTTGDRKSAELNYKAVKDFFRKFPQFQKHEMFLAGESYGGFYVPTLAEHIVEDCDINFKGFLIGNGFADYHLASKSRIYYLFYHGLISESLLKDLKSACCPNSTSESCKLHERWQNYFCYSAWKRVSDSVNHINLYNILDECHSDEQSGAGHAHFVDYELIFRRHFKREQRDERRFPFMFSSVPCLNTTAITNYLNDASVQKALHVDNPPRAWEICNYEVFTSYDRDYESMRDIYQKILPANNLKVLLYNGDLDYVVNYIGVEWFTDGLNFTVLEDWIQWTYTSKYNQKQVGGYVKKYEHDLTFATVKGAGHIVPVDKPNEIFQLISEFIRQ